jgi:hypothetical protein
MMTSIPPRLRKPAIYALAGVLFAAAWLVRGGPLWWVSIMAAIGTAAGAVRGTWGWPFLVTFLITGYGYLLGLSSYGVAEEGTPDDAGSGRGIAHSTRKVNFIQ